jgi:hypothetical protein
MLAHFKLYATEQARASMIILGPLPLQVDHKNTYIGRRMQSAAVSGKRPFDLPAVLLITHLKYHLCCELCAASPLSSSSGARPGHADSAADSTAAHGLASGHTQLRVGRQSQTKCSDELEADVQMCMVALSCKQMRVGHRRQSHAAGSADANANAGNSQGTGIVTCS